MNIINQDSERVDFIINTLLNIICKQYFTDASILPIVLSNDEQQIKNLQILDSLHQSVLTSLQFGQYRRASWYLQAFSVICSQTFENGNIENIINSVREHMQIEK